MSTKSIALLFTANELEILEAVYQKSRLPSRQEKHELAAQFGKTPELIYKWFTTRRAKQRRINKQQGTYIPARKTVAMKKQQHISVVVPVKNVQPKPVVYEPPKVQVTPVVQEKVTELPDDELLKDLFQDIFA